MDLGARPPAHAWDWFARQHLLWREARQRLATPPFEGWARYRDADSKGDVLALLRADYARHDEVRRAVLGAVADLAFLGRTDVSFERLGVRNPPRGMRWWWTALTGEFLDGVERAAPPVRRAPDQLSLDGVHEDYGD